MDVLLQFLHNSDNTYDVYLCARYVNDYYYPLVHGSARSALVFQETLNSSFGYLKVAEGDTFELHAPNMNENEYAKAVYTAASGSVTITSEHGYTTTLVELS